MSFRVLIYGLIWLSTLSIQSLAISKTTYKDAVGHSVQVSATPRRIVSLSPNLTEMLFAIGVRRERIVGVTRYCNFPPEVAGIHVVGGIVDPSVEGILAIDPDLVLATRGNPVAVQDQIRRVGIPVYAFDSQGGMDTVVDTMRRMIDLVAPDDTAQAGRTLRDFERRLTRLRRTSGAIAQAAHPTVYYFDPASPDWTAGPGTHVSEAIALAGGRNVADDAPVAWPKYGTEVLVEKQPAWILVAASDADTGQTSHDALVASLRARPGWRGLRAVQDGRICLVPEDWLMRPGPRVLLAIRSLGRCIHPDLDWGDAR
jgi:iron complex transport system substrate-binding protein